VNRFAALLALSILVVSAPARAEEPVVGLSSTDAAAAAVAASSNSVISSYELTPSNVMTRAILAARLHNADVTVVLPAHPYDPDNAIVPSNQQTAALLRRSGVRVIFLQHALHLKCALTAQYLFLSDRNFVRSALVVADRDPADRELVISALRNVPASNDRLQTRKGDALVAEAAVIDRIPGSHVFIESESFSYGPVYDAIKRELASGGHVWLLVSGHDYSQSPEERQALDVLVRAGVVVKLGSTNEKLAVSGPFAWAGSANSTGASDQTDWGMSFDDESVADAISARFARNWDRARRLALEPRPAAHARPYGDYRLG
jgi:hypothetical protein